MPDADVYQGDNLVAHLERTLTGVKLSYIESAELDRGLLATKLPKETIEAPDLPPFFLNLLPEGARLQLLLESSRSKDDSLGLLLKVGWDAIGDVAVLPHGEKPNAQTALIDLAKIESLSFWDLFYQGISDRPDSTVPGVQEKVSASTVAFGVRTSNEPSAILKLNPKKYPRLVQNEEFFLRMAKSCGLKVNHARLVYDQLGEPGLLVTRFDRKKQGLRYKKLHQEDGCQLCGAVPSQKYNLSMRQIADAIGEVCTSSIVEIGRLLQLITFSYVIGNADLHAKNISVIWEKVIRLCLGYDLLSTLPYTFLDQHFALKINGKDDNFKARDLADFGSIYGLPEAATLQMIRTICERAKPWLDKLDEIGFDSKTTLNLQKAIASRIRRISPT